MIDIAKVREAFDNANLKGSRSGEVINAALKELELLQKKEVAMKVLKDMIKTMTLEYEMSMFLAKGIGHYETVRTLNEFVVRLEKMLLILNETE